MSDRPEAMSQMPLPKTISEAEYFQCAMLREILRQLIKLNKTIQLMDATHDF